MSIRGNDQKIQNSAVFWLLLDIRERWIKTRARQTLSKNGRTSTLLSQLSLEGETHTLAFHWGIFFSWTFSIPTLPLDGGCNGWAEDLSFCLELLDRRDQTWTWWRHHTLGGRCSSHMRLRDCLPRVGVGGVFAWEMMRLRYLEGQKGERGRTKAKSNNHCFCYGM